MKPVVSVVIPTFGRHEQLREAVFSALGQDAPVPFEVIVVDDNPPAAELFRKNRAMLEGLSPSIRHLASTGPRGGSGARNCGILAARGEWVAFLDDDDEWLPGKLARQWYLAASAPADVACVDTGFCEKDEATGKQTPVMPQLEGWIFDDLLVKHRGRAPKLSTMLCRREALLAAGLFDTELPSRQDLDLYLRLARAYRFWPVREILAVKHVHSGARITTSRAKKLAGFEGFYRKYAEDLRARPPLHALFLRQYAVQMFKAGRYAEALRLAVRSLAPGASR